jgi:hypothetical protein
LRSGGGIGFAAAIGADSADFRATHRDFDAGVTGDLALQLFVKLAFDFAHFAAADAGNVDVVARAVAFVEVAIAAQVKQIELIDEAVTLQKVDRAVDGDARDFGIDLLRSLENFAGIEVAPSGFHYLEQNAPLASEANAPGAEFALQAARGFVDVDAFA